MSDAPAARVLAVGTAVLFGGLGLVLVAVGLWGISLIGAVAGGLAGLWLISVGVRLRWKARQVLSRKRP